MKRYVQMVWLALACSLAGSAGAESLESYSAKCDAATGTTVPDFVCSQGTPVPTTSFGMSMPAVVGGKCDRPNVLNSECDPGSHFQVLRNDAVGVVVAHCRKRGRPGDNYGDIAVIQYSKTNGATCFYQALGTLPGVVKAPKKGTSAYPWKTPADTASIRCAGCHDNGPLIRSPYLAQIPSTDRNRLPGAGDITFNRNQPYSFVGEDFAHWRVYKVEIAGNTCNGCHRMGVNNVGTGLGTAIDLGIRATAMEQLAKHTHSSTSPIWMLPGQTSFSRANEDAAKAIRDCAKSFTPSGPLPNTSACRISLVAGPFVPGPPPPERLTGIWEKPFSGTFEARHGLTTSAFQTEFDRLVAQGFRLTRVDGYESNGSARYTGVWDKVASPPWVARIGLSGTEFQSVFSSLLSQGFRLVWISGYTVAGKDLYAGIWEKSAGTFEARFGLTQAQLQSEFTRLVGLGFRPTVIGGYSVAGSARFVTLFEKRGGPAFEARVGLDVNAFQTEFNRLLGLGFRLVRLNGYRVGTQILFSGIWEQDGSKTFVARAGLTNAEFQAEFDRNVSQGFRLVDVSGY